MAKRTPGIEQLGNVIPRGIHELGPSVENRFVEYFVMWHWVDIVGDAIAANVKPIKIEYKILNLSTISSSWKNEIMMMKLVIIERVNEMAKKELIRDIRFTDYWEKRERYHSEAEPEIDFSEELSKAFVPLETLQGIDSKCDTMENGDIADSIKRLYRKQKKFEAVKLKHNWHKCKSCTALCAPEENYCDACKLRIRHERENKIRALLREVPWMRYPDIKEYVNCLPEDVNKERSAMVQRLAAKILFKEDMEFGSDVKDLVMLYRCLPPEQLNDDVIRRTVYRLRRDLIPAEKFVPMKRYDFIKVGKRKKFRK